MTDKELIKQDKEPKCVYNRTLEERKKFCKYCSAACGVRIEEEPASEDLEEEISNYIKDNFFGSGSIGFFSNRTKQELNSVDVVNIAHHFAEWQKQKDLQDFLEKAEKILTERMYFSDDEAKEFKNYMKNEM